VAPRSQARILIQPLYIVQGRISSGQLVPLLMDWELPLLTMNIAYQNRVRLPAMIRVFSDHIREHSQAGSWMDAKERVSRVVGRASGPSYSSQVHVGCDAC
jgi:hypothetical protein